MWRLYIVCRHRMELLANDGQPPSRELMQQILDKPPPFREQKALVHAELQVQALRSLRGEHEAAAGGGIRSTGQHFSLTRAHRPKSEYRPHGGVRLEGAARRGDLVGFFPGVVFTQQDVWHLPGGTEALADANAFARHNGSIVSASHTYLLPRAARDNRYALGHEVNHPPPKAQPNVIPFGLDIELAALPEELMAVLPCVPFSAVASAAAVESQRSIDDMFRSSLVDGDFVDDRADDPGTTRPALVLVALREIQNEELYFNYRLNPKAQRPHWYTPVSQLEEELRWRS